METAFRLFLCGKWKCVYNGVMVGEWGSVDCMSGEWGLEWLGICGLAGVVEIVSSEWSN
jgi:hypothetical protein